MTDQRRYAMQMLRVKSEVAEQIQSSREGGSESLAMLLAMMYNPH